MIESSSSPVPKLERDTKPSLKMEDDTKSKLNVDITRSSSIMVDDDSVEEIVRTESETIVPRQFTHGTTSPNGISFADLTLVAAIMKIDHNRNVELNFRDHILGEARSLGKEGSPFKVYWANRPDAPEPDQCLCEKPFWPWATFSFFEKVIVGQLTALEEERKYLFDKIIGDETANTHKLPNSIMGCVVGVANASDKACPRIACPVHGIPPARAKGSRMFPVAILYKALILMEAGMKEEAEFMLFAVQTLRRLRFTCSHLCYHEAPFRCVVPSHVCIETTGANSVRTPHQKDGQPCDCAEPKCFIQGKDLIYPS